MPRSWSASFRQAAESRFNDEVDLCFITISHPLLLEPIRAVWDVKNFVYGGETFIGFPFDITLLSDDDQPPRATLSFQNVDQVIAETVRRLDSAPRLKIELLSSADFNLTVDPREELATSNTEVVYVADQLFLTNVIIDPLQITAEIVGWDYLQRVWPGIRATQDLLPGLFQ